MRSAALQVTAKSEQQAYSTEVVCEKRELESLCASIDALVEPRACIARPEFFLASISPHVWVPRIVAIRQRGKLVGALYAKERTVAGIPTGILYGDATLTGMVVAEQTCRRVVFDAGIEALLSRRGTLGLRLLLPPEGYEVQVLESLVKRLNVDYATIPAEHHLLLPLGRTYDEFLTRLGARTRRNFRYYRRKSESDGNTYAEDIPLSEFRIAAEALLKQRVVGADRAGVDRGFAMFAQARRPILAGLRDKQGKWLSLLGGWYEDGRPIVFFQMNSDKHHSRSSLCLVLRGYFFERLIETGIRNVVFWAGVGEPLNRYSTPVPAISTYVDKRQKLWSGFRYLIAKAVRKLPREMAWRADWILPNYTAAAKVHGEPIEAE